MGVLFKEKKQKTNSHEKISFFSSTVHILFSLKMLAFAKLVILWDIVFYFYRQGVEMRTPPDTESLQSPPD